MSGAMPEEEMMDIRFEDVFFRYGTRALTLNGLDFSVKKDRKSHWLVKAAAENLQQRNLFRGFIHLKQGGC